MPRGAPDPRREANTGDCDGVSLTHRDRAGPHPAGRLGGERNAGLCGPEEPFRKLLAILPSRGPVIRLTDRLAAASEECGDYLDPDLAALIEALFWSRNPPPAVSPIWTPPTRTLFELRKGDDEI